VKAAVWSYFCHCYRTAHYHHRKITTSAVPVLSTYLDVRGEFVADLACSVINKGGNPGRSSCLKELAQCFIFFIDISVELSSNGIIHNSD
jgi:antitoxin component HigA of HigAB toxin-antitoxin module